MVQFLGNELFLGLMSDSDYGLIVSADVMDGEVVPYGKEFSEWHGWATNKYKKARQSVMIDGLLFVLAVSRVMKKFFFNLCFYIF